MRDDVHSGWIEPQEERLVVGLGLLDELDRQVGPRNMVHSWATNVDDATVDPRWGKVGKQRIEDAGTLYPKRMETVDDEMAIVTACAGIPMDAPPWPTVVMPVRIGNSPVPRAARLSGAPPEP